jgi:hypothetical protein
MHTGITREPTARPQVKGFPKRNYEASVPPEIDLHLGWLPFDATPDRDCGRSNGQGHVGGTVQVYVATHGPMEEQI